MTTTTRTRREKSMQVTSSSIIPTTVFPTIRRPYHQRRSLLVFLVSCFIQLLLLFIVPTANADWLMECGSCHCKWNSGKKTADCKNLSLSGVPQNLSPHIQVLDLSQNQLSHLPPNAFLHAQLHNLHKLYIRNASLKQIDQRSFTQLEILIELDLSHNLLSNLQVNQFASLVKVRALLLNHNLLETLGNGIFQHLKFLHRLELKNNRLTRIASEVFVNLPMLSQIYLDENRLSFLRKESFEHLKRLTALSLDQNPWNCTCELQIFRDFVLQRNLYTPPTACHFPVHLRGMLWIEDQPEAFACTPKIIYPAKDGSTSINTSKANDVTLICRVHASANTHISWNHNKQLIRANTVAAAAGGDGASQQQRQQQRHQQRVHIQMLRDDDETANANSNRSGNGSSKILISRLTIVGADKSDEGIYTCSAVNAGGKDTVQMSLIVTTPSDVQDLWLLQGNLVIVIALMALGLLSISFFITMVTCCIYKRFKLYNGLTPHHQHQHRHHQQKQQQKQQQQQQHQITTTAGNVIQCESTATAIDDDAGACGSGRSSRGSGISNVGIINSSNINEHRNGNVKTTTVGYFNHLAREQNTNGCNSNKTTKKFTNCLLREDSSSSYIVANINTTTDYQSPKNSQESQPSRHFNKETPTYPPSYELMPKSKKQTWTKSNINNKNLYEENRRQAGGGGGGDYKPDLLTAFNSNSSNSKVNS